MTWETLGPAPADGYLRDPTMTVARIGAFAAAIFAGLLANLVATLAVVGGMAGLGAVLVVLIRLRDLRDLAATTDALDESVKKLDTRVAGLEHTLTGGRSAEEPGS